MDNLKIILVDDNEVFRKALRIILVSQYDVTIQAEVSGPMEFLKLENITSADIILMDIMMPGMNGIELAKKILWMHPHLKIIAITMHMDQIYLSTIIEAGFKGCIFKSNLMHELGPCLKMVSQNGFYFPDNIKIKHQHS